MATPERVQLVCPLCGSAFRARTMGSSYFIAGVDTDLREVGSIEEVRRFSVASCQVCRYSDYSWDFAAPDELDDGEREALRKALGFTKSAKAAPGPALNRTIGDFERLKLASECFRARGLDTSSLAELALLAYYVTRDLGRRDVEPTFRDEAADLFERALEEEDDLPSPLRCRYAYLAGELRRRSGERDRALALLDAAIAASDEEAEDLEGNAWDIGRMARRMRAAVLYREADAEELLELARDEAEPEVATEACRILASRRDRAAVHAARTVWNQVAPAVRTEMLRELTVDPPGELAELFVQALDSPSPEDVRLGARALGALGDQRAAESLVEALERGVLSTEAALVEALRRLRVPAVTDSVRRILSDWEQRAVGQDDTWYFSSDPTPLRYLLYTAGDDQGLELLVRDLQAIEENDLWDKVPSGGPVSAALSLEADGEVLVALRGLLGAENPAARRWAAYCLAELGQGGATGEIRGLVGDPDPVVRLQAASSLAVLGDTSQEAVVLDELRVLDRLDLPFALHFLVPFKSDQVKQFLLDLLERGDATRSEVLPLLGRQEPDERVTTLLSESLLETNDETRAGAVTGLAYQGGPEAAERLRLLYDQEDADEVQRRIIFGLGQLARRGHHREQTVAFLRERLNRANPRLRFSMALTLLQLGDPTGIDIVRERAALFDESCERYDLVAPALRALADYEAAAVV